MKSNLFILGLFFIFTGSKTFAAQLGLEDFLREVKAANFGAQAASKHSAGFSLRQNEGNLLFQPQLTSSYTHQIDKRETTLPAFNGTSTEATDLQIGITEQAPFGLNGKLAYDAKHIKVGEATALIPSDYYLYSPEADLSLSLWRNLLGSEVRAQAKTKDAANRASALANSFKEKNIIVSAEQMYWRLAVAREFVKVQKDILARAQILLSWASRRTSLQLGDKSDMLQARAALDIHKIDLFSAQEEERSAMLAFNQALQRDGATVLEDVDLPSVAELQKLTVPNESSERLDVAAAREQELASRNATQLLKEQVKPTLELFGNYSRNGKDQDAGLSYHEGWTSKYPVTTLGVRFNLPLGLGTVNDVFKGAVREQEAASLDFQKTQIDAETEWHDLLTKFHDVQSRLELAAQIERTQKEKYENERQRLLRGRSTTYQTILFEQDLAQSIALRVRTQAELLRNFAQLKLFGEN